MTANKRVIVGVSLMVAMALAFVTVRAASSSQEPDPQAAQALVGTAFTYQGRLQKDGISINNVECRMTFRLFDGAGPLARQIGDTISLQVPISDGLFTVDLDFGSSAFRGYARWLDIGVQCPDDRDPISLGREELTAAPFALYALDAPWDGLPYAGVIVVAKSGGDYTSIQAAIDSISGAAEDDPYLVWIGPGVYSEQVTMVPYVHLQGAGQGATVITSTAGDPSGTDGPQNATLLLASNTSLRDLTVVNTGSEYHSQALAAREGTSPALVADVTTLALGTNASYSYAIRLDGSDIQATLQDVTALSEDGYVGYGLFSSYGAMTTVEGGTYTARGDAFAHGIENLGGTLVVQGATMLGEGATDSNSGFRHRFEGQTTLRDCSFAAHGTDAIGLFMDGESGTVDVSHSVLQGDVYSVSRVLGTARVSHSKLVGPVDGMPTCLAVSTETLFYTNTCP